MFPTLRDFVNALEKAGELVRIKARVSSMLEIAEIADRVSKSPAASLSVHAKKFDPRHANLGGKALLFENVESPGFAGASGSSAAPGSPSSPGASAVSTMPLLINAFGSYRRMEMALGCSEGGFESIADRIEKILKPEPPTGLIDKMKKGLELAKIASFAPKYVSRAACQEVVKVGDQVNLFELPIIKCWPLDGDLAALGYPPAASFGAAFDPWPQGLGRYITFAGIYTIHPDDAGKPAGTPRPSRNIGMYRAQLIDRNHTAMHWHMHHDGARHWRAWKARNQESAVRSQQGGHVAGIGPSGSTGPGGANNVDPSIRGMPCAIVFGGESVLPYAATAPCPPGVSELLMAGFLNDGGIPLVRCKTIDMDVPANAEIVIEGFVSTECGGVGWSPESGGLSPESRIRHGDSGSRIQDSGLRSQDSGLRTQDSGLKTQDSGLRSRIGPGAAFEGPFGDHTGFYSLPDRYPVFTVTAITHRRDPIYPTTIVGYPPQEDYYLGKATERIFLPLLKTLVHDIVDYHLPMFGAFHNCAFIKIRKEYPLQARRVMHAIWGAGQMSWTKLLVIVDEDVDVHDEEAVLFHLCANCDPGRDVEVVNGPLDILDHAAPRLGAGHKMGFDATRKIPGEEVGGNPVRDWPPFLKMDDATKALVTRRWREYGL